MTSPFKIIVKKLPTTLKPEEFLKTIDSFLSEILYHYFIPGKLKHKTKVFSMAYLVFKSEIPANVFLKTYNQTFIDHIGLVHRPVLEQALNQYFPSEITPNELEASHETDQFYQDFLIKLKNPQKVANVNVTLNERKPGQYFIEEKNRKFEKVRTPIIEELERIKASERRKDDKKYFNGSTKLITKNNQTKINMDNPRTDYGGSYGEKRYEKVYYEKKKYPEKSQKDNETYEYDEKSEKKKKGKKPKTYGGPKQVIEYVIKK